MPLVTYTRGLVIKCVCGGGGGGEGVVGFVLPIISCDLNFEPGLLFVRNGVGKDASSFLRYNPLFQR